MLRPVLHERARRRGDRRAGRSGTFHICRPGARRRFRGPRPGSHRPASHRLIVGLEAGPRRLLRPAPDIRPSIMGGGLFAHISTRPAALGRRKPASAPGWPAALAAVVLGLMMQACSSAPPSPLTGPDPSDPQAAVPPATYRSTVGGYVSRRPV